MLYIVNHVFQGAFPGGCSQGAHDHFRLFGEEGYNFIEIVSGVDEINCPAVGRKRNVKCMVMIAYGLLNLQVQIYQKKTYFLNGS